MARDRTRVAAVIVLVCAVGLVAATIDTGTVPESGGDGGSFSPNLELLEYLEFPSGQSDGSLCPAALDEPGGLAAALGIVGLGMAAGYRLLGSTIPVLVVGVPTILWSLGCSSLVGADPRTTWLAGLAPSPLLVLAAVVIGLIGTVGFLWISADRDDVAVDERHVEPDRPVDLDAIAASAGTAAARIDAQADVENEVYRAWLEMTDHLGMVRPETIPPAEFERLAIEAGMRPGDVSEITRLFRDVRYGERDPASRTDRAVAALERIEREYAEADE
ncbi:hypothetical protein C479_11835 [Halovivax asiaticus JCM 14624]|uniref:Protein-glutamine gamma-glutamyltransferase-like C-terminal domain-containing protein n=1 Tax=Halovivax asiaticus JCM 14624 TaxID=1227490 RepID=M0BGF0_9EURY|nr:DUF4129 domain-containing protein [Halovivax asiaticus]ELZ09507.1 hypothetical protein C479_11835 [Halovivax asiaticus JCM 14624]